MKKIILEVYEDMLQRIDDAAIKEGFPTRSEFLRFLIVTYLKENHPDTRRGTGSKKDEGEEVGDEFADVDLEFGIPQHVIRKLEEKARIMAENERRQLS